MAYMDRDHNGFLSDFERDADGDGIPNMDEGGSKDRARITKSQPADDTNYYDFGLFTLSYIDLVEKQTKDAAPLCQGINQVPFYCVDSAEDGPIDVQKVDTLDWLSADSDGDGIRDDADDADHDDVPNITEYLQEIAAPFGDRLYRQLDACVPNADSRFCLLGSADVDRDGIPNRDDSDDDGDGLPDTLEQQYKLDPLRADSDSDGVSDGFEYWSARDLNGAAVPFPGKAPYPNALDGTDADLDFDSDGLTLKQEYQAWNYSGRPQPLNYSDGVQRTGGTALRDGDKDVDNDGLTNLRGDHRPRCGSSGGRVKYDGHERAAGDAVPRRHTAVRRAELRRPRLRRRRHPRRQRRPGPRRLPRTGSRSAAPGELAEHLHVDRVPWTLPPGHTNPLARVNPYNPCKPINSEACHGVGIACRSATTPNGEDWFNNVTPRRRRGRRRRRQRRVTRDAAALGLLGYEPRPFESHRATGRWLSALIGPRGRGSRMRRPVELAVARALEGVPQRVHAWARGGRARRGAARSAPRAAVRPGR